MFFRIKNPILRTLAGAVIFFAVVVGIPCAFGLLGNTISPPLYPEGMFVIWVKGWLWMMGAAAVGGALFALIMICYGIGVLLFG